jgi:hypothetical protein
MPRQKLSPSAWSAIVVMCVAAHSCSVLLPSTVWGAEGSASACPGLVWQAPEGCPDAARVEARLRELSGDELLAVIGCAVPGAVIAQVSCDQVSMVGYCQCSEESCRAYDAVDDPTLGSSLLVRRAGDGLVGGFQNEIFLNARNLTVPLGRVRFERAPD